MWQAWKQTSIASPEGPIAVNEGEIVAIVVVPKWGEAFERLNRLLANVPPADRSKGRE
jgi:hypothetical protein